MFVGYSQNQMDSTYPILNTETKCIVLSHGVISMNKIYSGYAPIKETTNATRYILQDEYDPDKWSNTKKYYFKTEVNTEDVKSEHNVRTKQDSKE